MDKAGKEHFVCPRCGQDWGDIKPSVIAHEHSCGLLLWGGRSNVVSFTIQFDIDEQQLFLEWYDDTCCILDTYTSGVWQKFTSLPVMPHNITLDKLQTYLAFL